VNEATFSQLFDLFFSFCGAELSRKLKVMIRALLIIFAFSSSALNAGVSQSHILKRADEILNSVGLGNRYRAEVCI